MATQASPAPRDAAAQPAGEQRGHVVVFAYAHSGAALVQRLFTESATSLACTVGTGLLPLCGQAVTTWRQFGSRSASLSPLAQASVRALANGMITTVLAEAGRPRWCEIAFPPPGAAETFLQLYPGTRFVCLHRSCPDVVRAALQASPWGLAGTVFAEYGLTYPASSSAAVAAYWAAHTEELLKFEEAHPAACLRVGYEDLTGQPDRAFGEILSFLDLPPRGPATPGWLNDAQPQPGSLGPMTPVPAAQIPPPLLTRVNRLQERLGYPPIT